MNDRGGDIPSRRAKEDSWVALILSVVLVAVDWLLTVPFLHWWRQAGAQLPGIALWWLEPLWHTIAAAVLLGSAAIIRVRRILGVSLWLMVHVLYLALVAMVLYLPMIPSR